MASYSSVVRETICTCGSINFITPYLTFQIIIFSEAVPAEYPGLHLSCKIWIVLQHFSCFRIIAVAAGQHSRLFPERIVSFKQQADITDQFFIQKWAHAPPYFRTNSSSGSPRTDEHT